MSKQIDVSVRCILGKRVDQNDRESKGEEHFRFTDRFQSSKHREPKARFKRYGANKKSQNPKSGKKHQVYMFFDSGSEAARSSEEELSFDGTKRKKPKITSVKLNDSSALKMYEGMFKKPGNFFIIAKSISEMVRDQVQINQNSLPYRIAGQSLRWSSIGENNDRLREIQGVRRAEADLFSLERSQKQNCMTVRKKCRRIIQQLDRGEPLVLPEMPFVAEDWVTAPTSPESSIDESEIFQDDLLFSLRFPFRYFNYPCFCSTCDDPGHSDWQCPLRFEFEECRYCLGSHNRKACNQIGCMKCKQGGHEHKQCPLKVTSLKDDYCIRCKSWGHRDEVCSTLISRSVKEPDLLDRHCCVCAEKGHFEDFHFDGNIIKMFI